MKKRKSSRIIAVTAIAFLVLAIMFIALLFKYNSETIKLGVFYCKPDSTRTNLTIVGVDGSEAKYLIIPDKLSEMNVVGVANNAFVGCKSEFFIVNPTLTDISENGFSSLHSKFAIFLVGRENLDGMKLDENWNGGGEIIFGAVYPEINSALMSNKDFNAEQLDDLFNRNGFIGEAFFPDNMDEMLSGGKSDEQGLLLYQSKKDDLKKEVGGEIPGAVPEKTCIGISIVKSPTITDYIEGQIFEPSGIEVVAKFSDGTVESVTNLHFSDEPLQKGQSSVQISSDDSNGVFKAQQSISVRQKLPKRLEITTPPNEAQYIEGALFQADGMETVVHYDNATKKIVKPKITATPLSLGQGSVLLRYEENGREVKAEQSVTVLKKVPRSLEIVTLPQKTSYIEEDVFEDAGMVIKVTYNNGDTDTVTDYTFSNAPLGKNQSEIAICYKEDVVSIAVMCPIIAIPKVPTDLKIVTPPTKVNYIEDVGFDPTGLTTKVTYNNGKSEFVTATFDNAVLVFGQTDVELSYEHNDIEATANQPITVVRKTPTELRVAVQPNKRSYSAGLKFRPNGMVVEADYDNGKTYVVTTYTYPDVRLTLGQPRVVLTHKENGASLTATVPISVGAQMAVYDKHICDKTTCSTCTGQGKINTIVRCSRCNGGGTITSSSTCSSCGGSGGRYESNRCTSCGGDGQIGHACGGWCADCQGETITCDSCGGSGGSGSSWRSCGRCGGSGNTSSTSRCYNCSGSGQTGGIVTCSRCTGRGLIGSKGNLITDIVAENGSLPDSGEHTDGFWYVKKRDILDEDYISTLTVKTPPAKTTYIEGNVFDPAGMTVELMALDSEVGETVTPVYPVEELIYGQSYITVTYTDESGNTAAANQPITVIKRTPTDMRIVEPPEKTTYIENTGFITYGMKVEVDYDNGKTQEIDCYTFNPTVVYGQTEVVILYEENTVKKQVSQPITVVKKTPINLTITKVGYIEKYLEDEKFSLGDTEVTVDYNNDEKKVITPSFNDIPLVEGQGVVTLSYEENSRKVTVDVQITVYDKAPTELKVLKMPDKTTYSAGLKFNPAGMVVATLHANGRVVVVTDYTYPNVLLVKGQTSVTISYNELGKNLTADIPITVGDQMAVYEKWNTTLVNCALCNATGRISNEISCTHCGGTGKSTYCSTCSGSGSEMYGNNFPSGNVCSICGGTSNHAHHRTCTSCKGSGTLAPYTCPYCRGSGIIISGTKACSDCLGVGKNECKNTFIANITATSGSLPLNGKHTDGYWYVLKNLIQDDVLVKSNFQTKDESKITVIYEKWTVKDGKKKTYLADVTATRGSLPENGLYSDGSWYVLKTK